MTTILAPTVQLSGDTPYTHAPHLADVDRHDTMDPDAICRWTTRPRAPLHRGGNDLWECAPCNVPAAESGTTARRTCAPAVARSYPSSPARSEARSLSKTSRRG